MYNYIKVLLDFVFALIGFVILSPLIILSAIVLAVVNKRFAIFDYP